MAGGRKKKISAAFAILMSTEFVPARQGWCRASLELLVPLAVSGRRWLDVRETAGPSECVREGSKSSAVKRRKPKESVHCFQIAVSHFSASHDNQSDESNESIGWTRPPVSPHSIPEQPLRPVWEIKAGPSRSEPKVKLIGSVKHPLLDPIWQRAHSAILS